MLTKIQLIFQLISHKQIWYYFIENVIDYNPIQNGLTKVSLFKFEDLGSVPIDNSQQGNNDSIIDEVFKTEEIDYDWTDGSTIQKTNENLGAWDIGINYKLNEKTLCFWWVLSI